MNTTEQQLGRFQHHPHSVFDMMAAWEGGEPWQSKPPAVPQGNRLLARLPPEEYQRLFPRLQLVPLALKHVLYEARSPIDYAYFPNQGVVSALTVMEDGSAIEVATIGDEGMVGLPLIIGSQDNGQWDDRTGSRGEALRMAEDVLREEVPARTARCGSIAGPLPHRLSWPRFRRRWLATACIRFISALLPLVVDDPGPGAFGRVPDDAWSSWPRCLACDAPPSPRDFLEPFQRERLDPLQPENAPSSTGRA